MTKLQSYEDMKVETIWASPFPGIQVKNALTNTMADLSKFPLMNQRDSVSEGVLRFLFNAEHTSVIEHAVISFMVYGVSRSFLAQITRHRIGSFTSSSQHYQDYSEYPMVVNNASVYQEKVVAWLEDSVFNYELLLTSGIQKEEARQILPNACAVNLIWTVNARSLWNFMRLRMCYRNVKEMRIFCSKLKPLIKDWWPEYAANLGPPCFTGISCNQGYMTCGKSWPGDGI